jgi:acetyl esterase
MKAVLLFLMSTLLASRLVFGTDRAPLGESHVYKTVDGQELRIYVLKPDAWTPQDQRPAIVLFHGGGWSKGSPGIFNDHADFLRSKGFVCFLVQYRLIGAGETPEICIRDAKSAMRWVRARVAEWGLDPRRIAAGGGSAGGHLAAATALLSGFDEPGDDLSVSPKPDALVLINPVTDNGPGGYGHKRVGARYREFSPAHNITADTPPTLISSGTEDTVAHPPLLLKFKAAMDAAGARCDLKLHEGGKHGFYKDKKGPFFQAVLEEIASFFRSLGWLDPAPPP